MAYVTKNLDCGDSFKWRREHLAELRRKSSIRRKKKGYSEDGKCHIDGKPCTRAIKCEFTCFDVCEQVINEESGVTTYCKKIGCIKSCRSKFKCMMRNVK